jgi:hypothetical protein
MWTIQAIAAGGLHCIGTPLGGLPPKVDVTLTYKNVGGGSGKEMNPIGSFSEAIHRSGPEEPLGLRYPEITQHFNLDGSWPIGTYAGKNGDGGEAGVLTVTARVKEPTEGRQFTGTYTKAGNGLFMIVPVTCEILMGG